MRSLGGMLFTRENGAQAALIQLEKSSRAVPISSAVLWIRSRSRTQGEVAIFTLLFALSGRAERAEREKSCPAIELEGGETPRRR